MGTHEELERELRIVRETLDAVPAVVVRTNSDLIMVDTGRLPAGLTRQALIGRSMLEIVPDGLRDDVIRVCREVRETGELKHERYRDGLTTWEVFTQPLPNGDILHVSFDATREHAQSVRLAQAEESLRLARVASGLGLWSFDSRSDHVTWDEAMYEIVGTSIALTPMQWLEYVVEEDRGLVSAQMETAMATGVMPTTVHRLNRPDGQVRWLLTVGELHKLSDDSFEVHGCTIDVTEQRRVEEHLRETQRMETVGQLAAGVAHNFNNLLAVILPTLEMLHEEIDSSLHDSLNDATRAAMRAAELVRQLMTFARHRSNERNKPELISGIVGRAVDLCRKLLGALDIDMTDLSGGVHVRGNVAELEQVVINLLLNSRDAVRAAAQESPSIRVSVTRLTQQEVMSVPNLQLRTPITDSWVCVSVEDNGIGMTDAIRKHLFEPFFTTKDPGRGTGLGIATARATVRDSGGDIVCWSMAGVGTRFDVYLPASTEDLVADAGAPIVKVGGGHRILIVDDELAVRKAATFSLVRAGFSVTSVDSGKAAIAAAKTQSDVALVLLDRTMPGGSGLRFVADLRQLLPTAVILLFTGDDIGEQEEAMVDGIVQKPVSAASLVHTVIHAIAGIHANHRDHAAEDSTEDSIEDSTEGSTFHS